MFITYQVLTIVLGVMMWTLIGQGLLFLFAGPHRDRNIIYRFFALLNWPVLRFTRLVTPGFVVDRHLGFVAVFLILLARLGLYMFFYSRGWLPTLG